VSIRIFAPLLTAALLSGCATYRNSTQVQDGPGLDFKPAEVAEFRKNQDAVLEQLTAMAGRTAGNVGQGWTQVIDAGMDFADSKCEAYMHALFRLNRDKETVNAQIGLLGAATAGLMAAAQSAAKEVAATAVLFGLASSTVDNLSSNLLYDLDPSSVRTLVKTLQSRFRSSLTTGYDTRPAALRVIRAYAMLCVPANIEAEVNLAVKGSTPFANQGDATTGQPPEVSNAESAVSLFKARSDDNTALLRNFVFPGGQRNDTNLAALEKFIKSKNLVTDAVSFMRLERFAAERAEAAAALKLK
jgi:hypothetical protein